MYFLKNIKQQLSACMVSSLEELDAGLVTLDTPDADSPDLENMSPEERQRFLELQDINTQIQEIHDTIQYADDYLGALERGLTSILANIDDVTQEDLENPDSELNRVVRRIQSLQQELLQLTDEEARLRFEALRMETNTVLQELLSEVEVNAELTPEEIEHLSGLDNMDFLAQYSHEQRLRFVTKGNIDSQRVAEGEVEELEFTFTFGGEFNNALWRTTTAGQVLPPEVRQVGSEGVVYYRNENSLRGEFFSEGGQRFTIHEGTQVSDIEVGDVSEIEQNIENRLENLEGNENELLIARKALEFGFDPEFVTDFFIAQDNPIQTDRETGEITPEYIAGVEDFLTEIERVRHMFYDAYGRDQDILDGERFTPEFTAFFLGEGYDPREYENMMLSYSFSRQQVQEAQEYFTGRQEYHRSHQAVSSNPLNQEILQSGEVEVVSHKRDQVDRAVEVALRGQERYEQVAAATGIPWELIAAIHYRESSFDFGTYLHNGQRLGRRTTIVPRGILFHEWQPAAEHALTQHNGYYGMPGDDDLAGQAEFAERYNGTGYRSRGLASPYVWAGTSRYESQGGMFVSDGNFSQSARDPRVGVMPIIMVLRARQGKSTDI